MPRLSVTLILAIVMAALPVSSAAALSPSGCARNERWLAGRLAVLDRRLGVDLKSCDRLGRGTGAEGCRAKFRQNHRINVANARATYNRVRKTHRC